MPDYKLTLTVLGIVIGLIGYVPYFRDLYRGTTKPHFFSWFVWAVLGGIAFVAQLVAGGGWGSWVTGVMAFTCSIVAVIALFRGEKNIMFLDWVCFVGALIGIAVWLFTSNPVGAVVIVTVVDLVAFIPTFRKSYTKPDEETTFEYALASVKCALSIFALQSYSIATWLYPASLVISNAAFVVMSLVRRRQLQSPLILTPNWPQP